MPQKMDKNRYYPWLVVALLWGVALLNYMDRQMLSTMKAEMMVDITELESAANFGRLMAVFLWIYGLVSPFAGMVADRINRKWLIVGSLFVWSFVTLMMGYATSFEQLYALRAIMGISEALYIPAGLALITDYHDEKSRSLAVGIHMTGLYAGQALGGFGATIASAHSWQDTFHWFGIAGILYSLLLIALLREKRTSYRPGSAAPPERRYSSRDRVSSRHSRYAAEKPSSTQPICRMDSASLPRKNDRRTVSTGRNRYCTTMTWSIAIWGSLQKSQNTATDSPHAAAKIRINR